MPRQLWEFFQLTLKVNVHCQWDILLHTMTNFFSAGQHTGTSCMQQSQTAGEQTLSFTAGPLS